MKRLAVLALLPLSAWAAEPPVAHLNRGADTVVLQRLPDLLDSEIIAKELESGLTNTFIVRTTLRRAGRPKVRGGAHIRIRYDLWDEVYRISWTGGDGATHRFTAQSRGALHRWWREVSLPVVAGAGFEHSGHWRLKVELAFVPFSEAEQDATRRWLEGQTPKGRSSPGTSNPGGVDAPTTSYGAVLDVLVATSLRPEILLSFTWNISVRTEAADASENSSGAGGADDDGDSRRFPASRGPAEPQPDPGWDPPRGSSPA